MNKPIISNKSQTDWERLDGMGDGDIDLSDIPELTPEMFAKVKEILSSRMAILSATMGLCAERGSAYDEQKKTLIDDLLDLKSKGQLR